MPKIEDLKTHTRKFKKSSYRPWSFLDEIESELKEESVLEKSASEEKTVNKPQTNCKQTVNKLQTNCKQTANELEINRKQTAFTTVNKTTNKLQTNCKQIPENQEQKIHITSLVGIQLSVLFLIYESCKTNQSNTSQPLSIEYLSLTLKIGIKTIKTSIQRLIKKGCLLRAETKVGRGGWTKYSLPKTVFQELLQKETVNKLQTNCKQTAFTTALTTVNNLPSSSSLNLNKATTTELPEVWLDIDLSALESINFSTAHLSQLYKYGGFEPALVQNSIYHFAFDLEKNNKSKEIKTNRLSYFMGIMKRVGIYTAPENYESPRDQAMREYVESQKLLEIQRKAMEEELMQLARRAWLDKLSEEEKSNILLEEGKGKVDVTPEAVKLSLYFKANIWPDKKSEYLPDS